MRQTESWTASLEKWARWKEQWSWKRQMWLRPWFQKEIGRCLAAESRLALAEADVVRMREALIWMSAADDFAPGGKARRGFERIVLPLLSPAVVRSEAASTDDWELDCSH